MITNLWASNQMEIRFLIWPFENSIRSNTHFIPFSFFFFYSLHATRIAEPIIRLKVMSGKILIEWRHSLCREVTKTRYMDPDITRSAHIDIANIFFNPDQDDSDEISSEHNSGGKNGMLAPRRRRQKKKKKSFLKLSFQNPFRSHPGGPAAIAVVHFFSLSPFLTFTATSDEPKTNPIKKYLFEKFNCIISSITSKKWVDTSGCDGAIVYCVRFESYPVGPGPVALGRQTPDEQKWTNEKDRKKTQNKENEGEQKAMAKKSKLRNNAIKTWNEICMAHFFNLIEFPFSSLLSFHMPFCLSLFLSFSPSEFFQLITVQKHLHPHEKCAHSFVECSSIGKNTDDNVGAGDGDDDDDYRLRLHPNENRHWIYHITVGAAADNPNDAGNKLYNPSGVEVFYSMRHVEEAWHHLMKSEDTAKFKQIAVCNFDFLLASVSAAPLSCCCWLLLLLAALHAQTHGTIIHLCLGTKWWKKEEKKMMKRTASECWSEWGRGREHKGKWRWHSILNRVEWLLLL